MVETKSNPESLYAPGGTCLSSACFDNEGQGSVCGSMDSVAPNSSLIVGCMVPMVVFWLAFAVMHRRYTFAPDTDFTEARSIGGVIALDRRRIKTQHRFVLLEETEESAVAVVPETPFSALVERWDPRCLDTRNEPPLIPPDICASPVHTEFDDRKWNYHIGVSMAALTKRVQGQSKPFQRQFTRCRCR